MVGPPSSWSSRDQEDGLQARLATSPHIVVQVSWRSTRAQPVTNPAAKARYSFSVVIDWVSSRR